MKSTNAEGMNLPIRQLLRAESRAGMTIFHARWQTAVETVSGHALQKLRLELPHPVSELLLTSTHRSNNNDRNLNLVRTPHLPVSA
jgi:hypothetical protein